MKTKMIACFFTIIIIFSFSTALMADTVTDGTIIWFTNGVGNTGGGIFYVHNTSDNFVFESFCIERNEYLSFNTYYTAEVDTAAYNGGVGGSVDGSDPLSQYTAYLYYHFRQGDLNTLLTDALGTSFDETITADANSLQYAIWYFENEITDTSDAKALDMMALALANATDEDLSKVLVINPYSYYSVVNGATNQQVIQKQSVLELVPVPEPMTVLLLGLGLLSIGIARKRFTK